MYLNLGAKVTKNIGIMCWFRIKIGMLRHQFIFHKWGVFKGGLSLNAFHHAQVYPPSSECIL